MANNPPSSFLPHVFGEAFTLSPFYQRIIKEINDLHGHVGLVLTALQKCQTEKEGWATSGDIANFKQSLVELEKAYHPFLKAVGSVCSMCEDFVHKQETYGVKIRLTSKKKDDEHDSSDECGDSECVICH